MCGNGIRCVGKYVYERGLTDKTELTIDTKGGLKVIHLEAENGKVSRVKVDMGTPELNPRLIPVDLPGEIRTNVPCPLSEQKAYTDIRKGATGKYGFEIKTAGGQYTKLLQLCSGSLKKDSGDTDTYSTSKDEVLKELLVDNP
jgi:hypothetical protein